jgi:TATA-box binding protein (TBP) (component of TFIID and TFIIIB)
MTGLESKINQETIFQKGKIDNTKQNSTKKEQSADRNTIEDISKVVTDIKQTFYILENIVKK